MENPESPFGKSDSHGVHLGDSAMMHLRLRGPNYWPDSEFLDHAEFRANFFEYGLSILVWLNLPFEFWLILFLKIGYRSGWPLHINLSVCLGFLLRISYLNELIISDDRAIPCDNSSSSVGQRCINEKGLGCGLNWCVLVHCVFVLDTWYVYLKL